MLNSKFFLNLFIIIIAFTCIKSYALINNKIYLKSGVTTIQKNESNTQDNWLKQISNYEQIEGKIYRIIQFQKNLTNTEKKQLQKKGIFIQEYIPNKSYIASIELNKVRKEPLNFNQFNIISVSKILPKYKLSENINDKTVPNQYKIGKLINTDIICFEGISRKLAQENLTKLFSESKKINYNGFTNSFQSQLNYKEIDNLAQLPFVKFLSETPIKDNPESIYLRINNSTTQVSTIKNYNNITFDGSGVVISVGDDGGIPDHPDFSGRKIFDRSSVSRGSHGDRVVGVATGAGILNPFGIGIAPGANFVYSDYPNNLTQAENDHDHYNVKIINSSYSNGCNLGYSNFSRSIDLVANRKPKLSYVFSAGNSGLSNCGFGKSFYGNITGGHKTGKNTTTVGNTHLNLDLSSSSSRGPTRYGRLKPDIVALGTQVFSTNENSYLSSSGTSFSAPAIAGNLALLYNAYKHYNNNQTPTYSLMKNILLNTATDLGRKGPDYQYGWGIVNAKKAVETIKHHNYFTDLVKDKETKTHNITVPSNLSKLKVMVYWNDIAASTNTTKILTNNIDCKIKTPGNKIIYPWSLDPSIANVENLAVKTTYDTLNNVEQIEIDNPPAGNYILSVYGENIPAPNTNNDQSYTVSYQFDTNTIVIYHPNKNQPVSNIPNTTSYLYILWDAPESNSNFSIDIFYNNKRTWERIATNIGENEKTFFYQIKNNQIATKAQIRILRDNDTTYSDFFDIIHVPKDLKINWSCSNYSQISWTPPLGATHYDILYLPENGKRMDTLLSNVTDTFAVIPISSNKNTYISVRAKRIGDIISIRSIAIKNNKVITKNQSFCDSITKRSSHHKEIKNSHFKIINTISESGIYRVNITSQLLDNRDSKMHIIDFTGRTLKTINVQNQGIKTINIQNVASGIYFVRFKGISQKIIKL